MRRVPGDAEFSAKNQTIDLLADFSARTQSASKNLSDSLNAASRFSMEISTLSSKTSQALDGTLEQVGLPKELTSALNLLSQSLAILGEQLRDMNSSFVTNLQKPMEGILKAEIPSAKMKKEIIVKATKDLAEFKAKHAAIKQRKVDSAKSFELEQEESIIRDAVDTAKLEGMPILNDTLSSFSRFMTGSSADIVETLSSHCSKGVAHYDQHASTGEELKTRWTELRKEAFSKCPQGELLMNVSINEIILEGTLTKKAGQGRHWQSRHCVLKPGYLYYFDGNSLKGCVPLINSSVYKDTHRGHSHSFSVANEDRIYKFEAKDEADKMSWFTALLNVCGLGEGKKPASDKRKSTRHSKYEYDEEWVGGDEGWEAGGQIWGRYQELEGTVSSEKVYLANLEAYKVYRFNIQKEEVLPDFPQLFTALENLDTLFSLHATLLTKLEGILQVLNDEGDAANEGPDPGIGSCFISCISSFEVYSGYAKLYSQLKPPLARAMENPHVKKTLDSIRKKSATNFTLSELLALPLHRIHRYVPLLKQFRDSKGLGASDYETLNICFEKMSALVSSLESHISSEENEANILRIERQLNNYSEDSLYVHGRSFLMEVSGNIQKKGTEKWSGNLTDLCKKGGECTLFLFSDILLVATRRMLLNQYDFVEQIQLPCIHDLKFENESSSISLRISGGKEVVSFGLSFSSAEKGRELFYKMKEARDLAVSKRVFGVPLEVLMQQPANQNRDIPQWLEDALLHVTLFSLKTEGIFRISATARVIQGLKDALDEGNHVTFDKSTDPHAVACLIKLWLRELPEKLIPNDCWKSLSLAGDKEENEKKQIMKAAIESRPEHVQFLLQHLFCFMRLVASYSDFSKMNPTNLSIVFAPNLVSAEITLDPNLNKVVEQMVWFYDDVFGNVEKKRLAKKREEFKQVEEKKRSQQAITERLMKEKENEFVSSAGTTSSPSFANQVFKQGYLTKKGEVRRNWTTRWFVLRYNWLGYYKSPEEINNVPKGSIILKECTFEDTSKTAKTFSFSIHDPTQNRTFQIQAKNAIEHREWCEAIQKMIQDVSKE